MSLFTLQPSASAKKDRTCEHQHLGTSILLVQRSCHHFEHKFAIDPSVPRVGLRQAAQQAHPRWSGHLPKSACGPQDYAKGRNPPQACVARLRMQEARCESHEDNH